MKILNMFDYGIARLIEGADIDRPRNALTLRSFLHELFGDFQIYFEPVESKENTYRIETFIPLVLTSLPVTRELFVTESRVIELPSPRLLAVHCAIAHILHLSAAGDYIDKIIRDFEEPAAVRADGSTELGRLVQLRLDDWVAA